MAPNCRCWQRLSVCYDTVKKLPLGNARQLDSLGALLHEADIVSLHVSETATTRNMIGVSELQQMKPGSILLNASRGTVVDIDGLAAALGQEHLASAAVDVFPVEPKSNDETFNSPLRGIDNVFLTPHIGGSTVEAQANIGIDVDKDYSELALNKLRQIEATIRTRVLF